MKKTSHKPVQQWQETHWEIGAKNLKWQKHVLVRDDPVGGGRQTWECIPGDRNIDCCTVIGIVVEKICQKKRVVTIALARYMLEAGNESKQPQMPGMMLWVEMEADMGMFFWWSW